MSKRCMAKYIVRCLIVKYVQKEYLCLNILSVLLFNLVCQQFSILNEKSVLLL